MSLNMLRELENAKNRGVHFGTLEQCEADMKVGGGSGKPVSVWLQQFGVKNMSQFVKETGVSLEKIKRLYKTKRGELEDIAIQWRANRK